MTAVIEHRVSENPVREIAVLTGILIGLYLAKILFRFLASYLSHKAAWELVQEVRVRVYNHIQNLSMGFLPTSRPEI